MSYRAPGSPAWNAHLQRLFDEEALQPEQWWYLSFVKDEEFAGACVVRARGMATAINESHRQKCNPGGEVMAFPVGQDRGPHPPNRLLSKPDLGPGAQTLGELQDRGILPGDQVTFGESEGAD